MRSNGKSDHRRIIMNKFKTITALFAALSMMFVMSVSHAGTISFINDSNNDPVRLDVASQLSVDYEQSGNQVIFTAYNIGSIDSVIAGIYFDTGSTNSPFATLGVSTAIDGQRGASFSDGGDLNGVTSFDANFGADADPAPSQNGIDEGADKATGDYVQFIGTLITGLNYTDDFIAKLMSGEFKIGMHVISISDALCDAGSLNFDCKSDKFVSVSAVPVPAAAWLFGTALFGFFAAGRRKKIS